MKSDPRRLLSATEDSKGRLISIFAGAVLLPSLALSYVSMDFVQKLALAQKQSKTKRAESLLYYIEKELAQAAHNRARESARIVGTDRLLDGRPSVVRAALREAGAEDEIFESLHLEGSSPRLMLRQVQHRASDPELAGDLMAALATLPEEDSVKWISEDGKTAGTLRFRFDCGYVHGRLIRDYFARDFRDPDQQLVVRVSEPDGSVVYENAPTPDDRFEVKRVMESPSFRGLKLHLRYRDSSIEQEVNRWRIWTLSLIGFIDVMLGAGLLLVYSNVRRELHLSRLKSDFVANVSHELKTPLALIRLFAETLELGRVPDPGKAHEYYRIINKESQRLTQLINNILDFSRIEAGRKEYRLAPTDIGRVVSDVLDAYRYPIEQQGFTMDVNVADDLPEVKADKEALSQALLNLVNNAIKYSREEKHIRLEVERNGGRILVSVSDRGIGVAKGEQRKIFEKFYRAEDSLVHETKGSGLGLSLVRHIMEAHGGSVEVDSTPGKGSRFTLSLPIA